MNHVDDDAELYALGLTEPARGAEIEAHIAACDACRARVVDAEATAAALAGALPAAPARRAARVPRRWVPALSAAAAFAFAATAAFEGLTAHAQRDAIGRTDVALHAIAASHFGHTTLTAQPGVVAKALYARDGAWCYVVVDGAPPGAHVVLRRGAATTDAGALAPGSPATLFVRAAGKLDGIAVVAGAREIAHGSPAY